MREYLILLLLACSCMAFSQTSEKKKISIYGQIVDHVTRRELNNVKVTLLTPDGEIADSSATIYEWTPNDNVYNFRLKSEGKYIIRAKYKGYETQDFPIEINKIHKRESSRMMPMILLKKEKVRSIDEVVVTATKVKFYHKNDTLIYNADAFQLAEGSMLDELIKQLPGAELKSNGQIYVNGRFIESLLLNGKDFFKGNNSIMLDNLPTYTVNTVKVYEKASKYSEFLGKDLPDEKEFVMDVNLKKQYNTGWMGNVDAGGANHDLYMARLFAMRSTDHSRLTIFGNLNNINDFTTPQSGSDWTPDKMPYGRLTTKKAGVNLNIDDRQKRFEYNGNASFTHYDNNQIQNVFGQNFLSTGDTYDRMAQKQKFCNLFLDTWHKLSLTPGGKQSKVSINITQAANYSRQKDKSNLLSATSTESWQNFSDFVELLTTPILSDELRSRLINRQMENYIQDNEKWDVQLATDMKIKIPYCDDVLGFSMSGRLDGSDFQSYRHKRMDFFSQTPASTDFINQYTDAIPKRGYYYDFSANYHYFLNDKFSAFMEYRFNNRYTDNKNTLYSLDRLEGWGADTEHPIGTLPSEMEYLSTLDGNSFHSTRHDNNHVFFMKADFKLFDNNKSRMYLIPNVRINLQEERLRYRRADTDTAFTRNKAFVTPGLQMKWNTRDWKQRMDFQYNISAYAPDMLYSVKFVDDYDPMTTTYYGNKKLKDTQSHSFSFNYTNSRKPVTFSPYANLTINRNMVAMGSVYDRTTGRRENSFFNVNGNWNMGIGANVNGPLGKKRKLHFNSNTSWNYYNSVDMIGTETTVFPVKSTVRTSVLSEDLTLNYSLGKHSIGAKGSLAWTRSSGDRDDFTTINAYNFNYGVWGTMNLPWKFQINTDFTVYSRRGYEDPSMNDNNFVWNARLSRPFFKGKLVLKADAFDILHQLKKVDRSINVQGRTERYYNTLPRYILVHAIYRFSVYPKSKK